MRRLLLLATLGVTLSAGWALAEGWPRYNPIPQGDNHGWGPHATTVAWPSVVPSAWYTNTYAYTYRWYYPWYAYYNFSSSPYVNWPATGGYAGYANHGPAGLYYWPNPVPAQPYHGAWFNGNDPAAPYQTLQTLTAPPKSKDKDEPLKKPMEKPKDKPKD